VNFLTHELKWSDEQIQGFLDRIPITKDRLLSDSSWFDTEFADRFYFELMEATELKDLAYRAGLFVTRDPSNRLIQHLASGLLEVTSVYKAISKFASHFSKAATLELKNIRSNTATFISTPRPGQSERQYMCENRRGTIAGVPCIFKLPPAHIDETECLHRGDQRCVYEIRWASKSASIKFLQYAVESLMVGALGLKLVDLKLSLAVGACWFVLRCFIRLSRIYKDHKQELLNQNKSLAESLSKFEEKNQQLLLVSDIAKRTAESDSPKALAQELTSQVCKSLGYDRSILLLTEPERQVLRVEAFYGFSEQLKELLESTEFNLDPSNTTGFFVKVANTQQPLLIHDVIADLDKLSPRSQKFAKILGSKSFVAVPLLAENRSIGVLAVDLVNSHRELTHADEDLLETLAEHLSISLSRTKLLAQINESLDLSRRHSQEQLHLRRLFQKFVPTEVASALLQSEPGEDDSLLLKRVKKRATSIMFGDIFSFSTISNELSPEDVIELLNTVFSEVSPIVTVHQGFIDKFTGDGFIAVFDHPDSQISAVAAGYELLSAVPKIQEKLREKNLPAIDLGLGVHYGTVIHGNTGSEDRLNYTVIGEPVNLAARLEAHTRQTGPNTLCASANIYAATHRHFEWKDLGEIQLKGYDSAVQIYELKASNEQSQSTLKSLTQK
jgi:class 3 adenylate cyclase/putative methionine-R-sulfoxide reductase with GAF domain